MAEKVTHEFKLKMDGKTIATLRADGNVNPGDAFIFMVNEIMETLNTNDSGAISAAPVDEGPGPLNDKDREGR